MQSKQDRGMAEAAANHANMIATMRQTVLNKLCLVGVQGQGVERTFITDIKGSMIGAIALRICAQNIDDGIYFDARSLVFYHVYDEKETAEWVAKYEKQQAEGMLKLTEEHKYDNADRTE